MTINKKNRIKFYRQLESLDCAPACLKMVCAYYGKKVSLNHLRNVCNTSKLGTSIYSLTSGAEQVGLETISTRINISSLNKGIPLPAILLWNKTHFVVLNKIVSAVNNKSYKFFSLSEKYLISDPGFGILKLSKEEFSKKWCDDSLDGVAIFLEPKEDFDHVIPNLETEKRTSKAYLMKIWNLISNNKLGFLSILFGLIISTIISLAFPIFTQRIVDIGIKFKDIDFILLVLFFQLGLFLSMLINDAVKGWIALHIGAKIELSLTYDFLVKMMRLPLHFFDMKVAGDLMQRIGDNTKIQNFIRTQVIDLLVSAFTIVAVSGLLFRYNSTIFIIFFFGSFLSIGWALYFIRRKELLDYRRFDATTENTDNLIETIVAMPEVKLNNAEEIKIGTWQKIQLKLFSVNTKILSLQQLQSLGANAINQLKNISVTFLAAQQVINNQLSIGEMLALSVIIGQLNVPLSQMVGFIQNFQESRISFQRLAEVQSKEDEDAGSKIEKEQVKNLISNFNGIEISNISFSYSYSHNDLLFDNLSLTIPAGKMTALVGSSGSGKTTLMKLLLKFYEPLEGAIKIGPYKLNDIKASHWRSYCGTVLQEGHIFTDTVENNIAMSSEQVDKKRLEQAVQISCIEPFIKGLPMGFSTKIGAGGMNISTGQKQRILIARAVYKNPEILFLDEATSSLDTNNESNIQQNLESFFKNKTIFLIAHRLSTVRNADNIIVLKGGKIIEQGKHENLVNQRGEYYGLIKNQLELGN